ncbi:MAG: homoserine kinase [Nitrospinota bacterium]
MAKVTVRVPASTTNLGPGFDALGIALSLYNEVRLEERPEGLRIEIEGEGRETLPRDEENIVFRAVGALYERVGRALQGLSLHLTNRIPLARGLGSSSAARVGGLLGANHLLGEPLSREELSAMATGMEGHPDNVVPALFGGFTVAALEGERLLWSRAPLDGRFRFVVAIPEIEVATPEARAVLPEALPHRDAVFNVQRVALLMAALAGGDGKLLSSAMEDRLHQPYRAHLMGPLDEVFRAARDAGALGVSISGAGSSVLALALEAPERVGAAMEKAYLKRGIACRSLVLEVDSQGAIII